MNTIQPARYKARALHTSQVAIQTLAQYRWFQVAWFIMITMLVGMVRSQIATATLSGKVVEAANGESLPGAAVQLWPGGRGTSADQNGRFVISYVLPGKYLVQITFIGFETKRDSVLLTAERARYLHIALKQQPLKFPEITVTDERDRRIKEVNLSRELIGGPELRMTTAVAEPDLFRSLVLLPGVSQANDFNSRFYVRGGQSNENHVLVEGMTIHNPYHGLGFFSTFDVDAIKAVEVYRSNFPVRYNERLSSVTNVILRDGNAQRFSGLGMISLATSKLLLEGPLLKYRPDTGRKWTFMLNGRRTYADAFLDYPLYFHDFSLKSVYDSGRKTRVTLHGFYGMDRFHNRDAPFPFPSFGEIFSDIRWNNLAVGVRWQQFLSNGSIWSNHVSYSTFHSLAKDARPSPVSIDSVESSLQDNKIRELSFNSEWQGGFLKRLLTVGYQWSRFHIDQDLELSTYYFIGQQPFSGTWRAYDQHKAYLELDGGWGDRWLYEAGLAALYYSAHGSSALAPRLGVKYLVNDTWRVKAGASRHYQNLTTLEDDDDPVALYDAWLPTPRGRKLAAADHYGLGVEISPSSDLEAEVELYYHRNDHLTRYNRTQRAGEPFYLNGRSESYGFELRGYYNLKKYYGFANYSLGWATSSFLLRNQPMRFANDFRWQTFPTNSDIRHILNTVIGVRPGGKWDFSMTFVFQSGRPYTAVLGGSLNLVETPYYWDLFQNLVVRSVYLEGLPGFIYSSKNGRRYPFYQRLDFRAAHNFRLFDMDWSFFFQVYNVFYRKNPAFRFPDYGIYPIEPSHPKGLPIVPTFGVTARF